jgi:hypothetical protein
VLLLVQFAERISLLPLLPKLPDHLLGREVEEISVVVSRSWPRRRCSAGREIPF